MNNPKKHNCLTCGYEWKHGFSGSHRCSDTMKVTINNQADKIKELETELASMTHAAKELYSVISEHSLMPCRSLETRMMQTASRYSKRIFKGDNNEPK